MYFITITNWKKKILFLVMFLLVLTLALSIISIFTPNSSVNSEIQSEDKDILSQPIKVQSDPILEVQPVENNIN